MQLPGLPISCPWELSGFSELGCVTAGGAKRAWRHRADAVAWALEFNAPNHDVYKWSNGRGFDSTDLGTTGIYKKS